MAEKPTWEQIEQDRDKRVDLPLDPEEALRALMQTGPHPDGKDGQSKSSAGHPEPAGE